MEEIAKLITNLKNEEEICKFFAEIFTPAEIKTLSKRWRILKALSQNETQREIAKQYNVSLCKVTRGAKILKDKDAITTKFLAKDMKNE